MKYKQLIETLHQVGLNQAALRNAFEQGFQSFTQDDWQAIAGYGFSTEQSTNISFLYLSAQYGWVDIATKLIENGAIVGDEILFNGGVKSRAIDLAIAEQDLAMVKLLTQAAIYQKSWNPEDESIIGAAIQSSPEVFEYLIDKVNIYKKAIKMGKPSWAVLLLNKRHDIFCHLLKKGLIKDEPENNDGFNYALFMMWFAHTVKLFSESDLVQILPQLIEAGVNLNTPDNEHRNILFWALHFRWFELVKMIIESGHMNIAEHTPANTAVYKLLKKEKMYPMMKYLLGKGLLSQAKSEAKSALSTLEIWDELFATGNTEVLLPLILESSAPVRQSLHHYYPIVLQPDTQIASDPSLLNPDAFVKSTQENYKLFFDEDHPAENIHNKKTQIKITLSELAQLMCNTNICISALGVFEQMLKENWNKEFAGFPIHEFLAYQTTLKEYAGTSWPVPTEDKRKLFKKNGFLEKQCIQFMQARGFAQKGVKMYGVTFDGSFERTIQDGDFFTENNLDPHLLIHGKNIHNLARIMIMIFWENNLFTKNYIEDGAQKTLTLPDLFSALVNPEYSSKTGEILWVPLLDKKINQCHVLTDPFQMHATFLTACKESLPYLSRLMNHSFCHAVFRITDFINDTTGQKWTPEQVWDNYIATRIPNIVRPLPPSAYTWLKRTKRIPEDSTLSNEAPITAHRLMSNL